MKFLLNLVATFWIALSALFLIIITTLSLSPLHQLPPAPGSDHLHHFIAYAALTFPAALRKPKHLIFILLFFTAWSGMIELIQPYFNRYGEVLDMLANSTGIALGYVIATAFRKFFHAEKETAK